MTEDLEKLVEKAKNKSPKSRSCPRLVFQILYFLYLLYVLYLIPLRPDAIIPVPS
jgi:hypothetical protein